MSEKQTDLSSIILKLAESNQLAKLTELMLIIENSLKLYERLEIAATAILDCPMWDDREISNILIKIEVILNELKLLKRNYLQAK